MFWKDLPGRNPIRKRPWSLAGRLTTWYALTSSLFIIGTATLLYWALTANLSRDDDLFLADKIHV